MRSSRVYGLIVAGVLVTALLLAALVGAMRAQKTALAQAGPGLRIARHLLGHREVVVVISGTGLSNVGGFEADLVVDPAVARASGFRPGPFLDTSGRITGTLGPIVSNQGGTIAFGEYSYDPSGNNAGGASGDGALAYVTMTVAADGVSALTLQNVIVGDIDATSVPVTMENAALQARTLHHGWNLMAPCVDTRGLSVAAVVESLQGDYDLILGEQGTFAPVLSPMFWTLSEMTPPWAYWVRVTSSLPITFTQVAGMFDPTTPITLAKGWHWIGYCVSASQPVSVALQSIAGKYNIVIGETGVYVPGLPPQYQTLRSLDQEKGYLVRMVADGVLQYPAVAPLFRARTEARYEQKVGSACRVARTPYMTLVYGQVRLNGQPAPPGTVVEAITPRGEVAGCFEVHTASYFGVVQVYGADEPAGIPGFRAGEPITWQVNGVPAVAEPRVTWQDDKTLHEVILRATGTAGSSSRHHLFVPWVAK